MPIYEYKCKKCDKVFEVRQKFSDDPLTTHEECGGPVHRLLSAPAFQFKGSGWYVTDYARSGASKRDTSITESKSESKADSNGSKTPTSDSKISSSETSTKSEPKPDSSTK